MCMPYSYNNDSNNDNNDDDDNDNDNNDNFDNINPPRVANLSRIASL